MKKLVFLIAFLFLLWGSAQGQYYFGKNKIQYTNFDWQVLTTQHFEIYFYTEEKEIAQIAASCAEESYRFLENKFNHRIKRKMPFVIYSSPNYFAQTNIIPSLLPESVAGFTEYMKGRMVVPFDGSYSNFARVLQHELVHVFVMHKLPYVMKSHRRLNYTGLPLWFEEGLAEHWSRSWDSEADMMMRDLVISGRFLRLEDIYRVYGTYLMYKIGEGFCAFLEREYGDDRIGLLLENYWKAKSFSGVFELTFNRTLKDVWDEWEYSLKKKYFPQMENKDLPERISTRLTFDGINIKPEPFLCSDEEWVVYKSNRLGYSSIRMMPAQGEEEKSVTLIKGERSSQFESLHLLKSKIGVSEDGKIAFVSKSHENDVLYVYNIEERRITHKRRFAELIELSSPDWSPDAQKVAFVGVASNGFSDIYVYDFEEDRLIRLTDDIYEEKDPAWAPDGKHIAFVSDRGRWGEHGFQNLFLLNLPENKIQALTSGAYHDQTPDWSSDGKQLAFTSDRSGSFDLYLMSMQTEADSFEVRQLTSLLTGAFDPSFSPDGKTIFFTAYEKYSFQINRFCLDSVLVSSHKLEHPPMSAHNLSHSGWKPKKMEGDLETGSAKYENRFSFDIAQSVISYDAV
jgi:Tol biopolymer transport system component